MFNSITSETRISLCTSPIDMRKSFNGLIGVVRHQLNDDPLTGHLFVFFNKTNTLVKILYWDGDGFAIWYKRLEVGTFRLPSCDAATQSMTITRAGLSMLLEGVDLSQLPKRKRFSQSNCSSNRMG